MNLKNRSTHERVTALIIGLDILVNLGVVPGGNAAATVRRYCKEHMISDDELREVMEKVGGGPTLPTLPTPTAC